VLNFKPESGSKIEFAADVGLLKDISQSGLFGKAGMLVARLPW